MTRRLGKYEILDEIGKGGFATVYRARDPALEREVALKVLDPLLMRDPALVERFRREARAAARLRHPHIVRIHDITDAEGMLTLVMELLPGPSLAELVEAEAPLSLDRAVALLRPLAEALDYAHAQGLVHRDVKPSNAILDPDGQPVLTDFGLVRAAEESGSAAVSLTLSQTGMTLGTPAYMAPEQADPQARSPVDCRADLYSLAVVAYQMLTGRVPFQGTTPLTVAMGHLLEPPPPPQDLNPDLPEGVAAALVRGLAKKPEDRFERASALVEAIEAGAVPAPVEEVAPSPAPPPLQEPKAIPAEAAIALATRQPPQTVPQAAIAARKVRAQRRGVPLWAWVVGGLAAVALVVWMVTALGGGGSGPTPGPLPTIRETAAEVTNTARPTETPTLWPTNTPWPTNTASLPAVIPEADATPETTATESPPASETTIWHTVQRGETMSSIAQKYATTWQAIVEANGLTSPNQIYVGMKLKIPATGGTPSVCRHYHTIQPGEWIWQIARNYGVDPYDLMAVNGLTLQTADPPSVGQVLCIP